MIPTTGEIIEDEWLATTLEVLDREDDKDRWLETLVEAVGDAITRDQLRTIDIAPSVVMARSKAGKVVRDTIGNAFTEAAKRLAKAAIPDDPAMETADTKVAAHV
jgi:hypothetical protein